MAETEGFFERVRTLLQRVRKAETIEKSAIDALAASRRGLEEAVKDMKVPEVHELLKDNKFLGDMEHQRLAELLKDHAHGTAALTDHTGKYSKGQSAFWDRARACSDFRNHVFPGDAALPDGTKPWIQACDNGVEIVRLTPEGPVVEGSNIFIPEHDFTPEGLKKPEYAQHPSIKDTTLLTEAHKLPTTTETIINDTERAVESSESLWAKFARQHWGTKAAIIAVPVVTAGGVAYWALREKGKDKAKAAQLEK